MVHLLNGLKDGDSMIVDSLVPFCLPMVLLPRFSFISVLSFMSNKTVMDCTADSCMCMCPPIPHHHDKL